MSKYVNNRYKLDNPHHISAHIAYIWIPRGITLGACAYRGANPITPYLACPSPGDPVYSHIYSDLYPTLRKILEIDPNRQISNYNGFPIPIFYSATKK